MLRVLVYAGLFGLFFGLMSIHNWPLLHLSRTLASTLLTWFAMTMAMSAVYGGYEIGRRKSRPIIANMLAAALLTDAVTYVQLQIMNTNANANETLVLFGQDFPLLLLCAAGQCLWLMLLVRGGNALYFRHHPPLRCLLVLSAPEEEPLLRQKLSRYRLQWQVSGTALADDSRMAEKIRAAQTVFIGHVPEDCLPRLLRLCNDARRDVLCRAQLATVQLASARTLVVDDMPFLEMVASRMTGWQRLIKRSADILLSALVLAVLSPLMGLIALAIRLQDGGPAIFRQQRLTRGGRTFTICKFRTMSVSAADDVSVHAQDSRVTPLGRVLRRTRLDELPQLWNILRGDMSLVGPRPEMLANIDRYKAELPAFAERERMKAGLTGYAQIEGRYNTSPEDKLLLDMLYIQNFSLSLDFRLLLRTATVLLRRDSTEGFQ